MCGKWDVGWGMVWSSEVIKGLASHEVGEAVVVEVLAHLLMCSKFFRCPTGVVILADGSEQGVRGWCNCVELIEPRAPVSVLQVG